VGKAVYTNWRTTGCFYSHSLLNSPKNVQSRCSSPGERQGADAVGIGHAEIVSPTEMKGAYIANG
jgi:hypothetical protein